MRLVFLISLTLFGTGFRASAATAPAQENAVIIAENSLSYLFTTDSQAAEKTGFTPNRKNEQPPVRRVRRRTRRRTRRRVERREEKTGFNMQVQQQELAARTFFSAGV